MTFSKTAMTVSSLALAMLFGGGVYIMMNMNVMAKAYIERTASEALGVGVTLGGLEVSLPERTAKATKIIIRNPEGFAEPYALQVSNANIVFNSVSKELIHFKEIDVSEADVNLEVRKNITNLAAIKNRIKVREPEGGAGAQPKVIIDKLVLSKAQIKPAHVLFTQDKLEPVNVPDVVLKDIGQRENGVTAQAAARLVWAKLANKLNEAALQNGFLEGMPRQALGSMGLGFGTRFKANLRENIDKKVEAINENVDLLLND